MLVRNVLAIPYAVECESVESDGQWLRRLSYPELPGCTVEAPDLIEALRHLERLRLKIIFGLLAAGEAVPVPRRPLVEGAFLLSDETLGEVMTDTGWPDWASNLDEPI